MTFLIHEDDDDNDYGPGARDVCANDAHEREVRRCKSMMFRVRVSAKCVHACLCSQILSIAGVFMGEPN